MLPFFVFLTKDNDFGSCLPRQGLNFIAKSKWVHKLKCKYWNDVYVMICVCTNIHIFDVLCATAWQIGCCHKMHPQWARVYLRPRASSTSRSIFSPILETLLFRGPILTHFCMRFAAIAVIGIQHKTLEAHRRNDDKTVNFGQIVPIYRYRAKKRQNKTHFLQGLHCKSGARTPANSSRAVSWRPEGLKSFYGQCHICAFWKKGWDIELCTVQYLQRQRAQFNCAKVALIAIQRKNI